MSRLTPVASPSPPLRSASRHQTSPQLKSNYPDLTIHRKSSEPICESPSDFQLLSAKSTEASYQDEDPFPANCKTHLAKYPMINGYVQGEKKRIRKYCFFGFLGFPTMFPFFFFFFSCSIKWCDFAKCFNVPVNFFTSSFLVSTPTIDIDADNICDKISVNTTHQQFCLRWNNYGRNLTNVFDQLLHNESFVDVTLACDGQSIKAHKMVLSACSPYFQSLFFDNPCQHPIIIMRDVKWTELKAIVEFMYKGEIKVSQGEIGPLLRVAEMLKIRGLTEVNGEHDLHSDMTKKARCSIDDSPRPPSSTIIEHNRTTDIQLQKKSRPHKRLSGEWDESRSNNSPTSQPSEKQRRSSKRSTSPPFDRHSIDRHSTDSPRIGNSFELFIPLSIT